MRDALAILVFTLNLPSFTASGSGDKNDLGALARLALVVPHRVRPEDLQFGEATWSSESLENAKVSTESKMTRKHLRVNTELTRHEMLWSLPGWNERSSSTQAYIADLASVQGLRAVASVEQQM